MDAYRLIVGEIGNEQGHTLSCKALSFQGAMKALKRALAPYGKDGWGRIEVYRGGYWERLCNLKGETRPWFIWATRP